MYIITYVRTFLMVNKSIPIFPRPRKVTFLFFLSNKTEIQSKSVEKYNRLSSIAHNLVYRFFRNKSTEIKTMWIQVLCHNRIFIWQPQDIFTAQSIHLTVLMKLECIILIRLADILIKKKYISRWKWYTWVNILFS